MFRPSLQIGPLAKGPSPFANGLAYPPAGWPSGCWTDPTSGLAHR